ncbi:hypothetical protein BGX21_010180 [Mortierella sp. AD011]|nr:hypothetical protein BGX20_002443 [Mortierella sp. AD010]KAF9394887.1 hypothetical protein BGX21_010180 [Mortierella sp. AD011]
MSTGTTVRVSQVTAKKIPFTAFQALWIPGTTRICSLGSNDAGFGVIQVHVVSSASASSPSSESASKRSSTLKHPRLVLHSETEKKVQFKSGTFHASARSSSSPHLLAGDFEGRVGLWDLSRTEVPLNTFKAHEDVVNCMDGVGSQTGRPEFVTGCRDGTVKLWDMRQNHKEAGVVSPISNISRKSGQAGNDVWCVSLGSSTEADDLMVVAGYDNGDVRVMDIRMGRAVFETNVQNGVCAVEFDKRQNKAGCLVATTLEGALHSFDLINGQFATADKMTEDMVTVQSGDDSTLWQARHIPQRPDILAVTDGGGNIHMYQHGKENKPMVSLVSHKMATQGILSLEFNEDLEGLFVGSDLDNTLRVGMVHL